MRRSVATAALVLVALFVVPSAGESQTWPETRGSGTGIAHWIVGAYAPAVRLGSFAQYDIFMDPWPVAGVSFQAGDPERRFRTRFEVLASPGVAMRRAVSRNRGGDCLDCTPDSHRLTLLNTRFLFDLTFGLSERSRGYLTVGPAVRVQVSDAKPCVEEADGECALPHYGRNRLDPGIMAGVGWEPSGKRIRSVQLGTRMSFYGHGEHPEAAPRSWLPELDLTVRFSLTR